MMRRCHSVRVAATAAWGGRAGVTFLASFVDSPTTVAAALLLLGFWWNLNTAVAQELPVDMAPFMAEPAGRPVPREPRCEWGQDTIDLSNATLRCRFSTADRRLTLRSLHNEFTTGEMLLQPGLSSLFVVEGNGKRFRGSRDFDVKSISRGDKGFQALLGNAELAMQVILQAAIETEGLRFPRAAGDRSPSDWFAANSGPRVDTTAGNGPRPGER
jgi:hypothetical protein